MDLSHELGALRFVVDSPLSSKVAMFNQQVSSHKQGQLLNPFANTDGRASPKPSFSKDEYGKPLAGSLTEMRGQKANMHVLREMLELCQIIDSEGYAVKDEPTMRVIPFGELFNIYNYISDKCVGICLRARKHKLIEFEGEMLFQRRDDDVPIFLLRPIQDIRHELQDKIESIKRCGSASPQATSVLLDKKGLNVPKGATPRSSVSRTPSPNSSRAPTPTRETQPSEVKAETKAQTETPAQTTEVKTNGVAESSQPQQLAVQSNLPDTPAPKTETKQPDVNNNQKTELPTIVIEASAEHPANTDVTSETTQVTSVEPSAPAEAAASA